MWINGFISQNQNEVIKNKNIYIPKTIKDQYIFIKRFYKFRWVLFSFIVRILSFNNPYKELKAFINTKKIKYVGEVNDLFPPAYSSFTFNLHSKLPLVTVIIPTLNRYGDLKNALLDLDNQKYRNFEVFVVDQSDNFSKSFYEGYKSNIRVIRQKEKALWKARNNAIKLSNGDYILLFDDDSRVNSDWIEEHLRCIEFFNCSISAGVSISVIGAPIPKHYSFFRWGDQIDTGNVMIKKEVFRSCGLFDTKFEKMRMGDSEYGVRAYLNGFHIVNNPKAQRLHIKSAQGGLRFFGHWDGMRPKIFFSPRPIPSVLYLFRKYWGNKASLYYLIRNVPLSLCPYKLKGKFSGYIVSFFIFLLFMPIILIQIYISWRKSKKLLYSEEKIDLL